MPLAEAAWRVPDREGKTIVQGLDVRAIFVVVWDLHAGSSLSLSFFLFLSLSACAVRNMRPSLFCTSKFSQ